MIGGKSVAKLFCMLLAVCAVALFGIMPGARLAAQSTGAVYVLSNQPVENAVIVFHRNADGTLLPGGSFPTGGAGFGSGPNPLGSQGALMLSADNRLLFAVNAGSDSITSFSVAGDSLTALQTVPSGGTMPVSLTVYKDMLYVLNSGGACRPLLCFRRREFSLCWRRAVWLGVQQGYRRHGQYGWRHSSSRPYELVCRVAQRRTRSCITSCDE